MILGIIASFIGMIVFVVLIFMYTSSEFGARPSGDHLRKIESSNNYSNGKFQNKNSTDVSGKMEWGRSLREYMTSGNKVPNWSIPVKKITPKEISTTPDTLTKVTWFGHSALLLEMDGKKIFIDPMLGEVPAPHPLLGSKRFNDTLPLSIDEIPPLDAVLISHDHYDHLDYGSIQKLKDRVGHFYVPLGVSAHLISWGVKKEVITEMDWWDTTSLGRLQFTAAPARHFSGRGITDRFKTQWSSWIIEGSVDKIYFSGDSGYDTHFKEIGDKYGPFDLAIMECGQYDEQWPLIHMMPEETVQATLDVKADLMLPIHWGSFKLSLHAWEDPIERSTIAAKTNGVKMSTPIIGETITIGEDVPNSRWWEK